jgi:hypothetical protein
MVSNDMMFIPGFVKIDGWLKVLEGNEQVDMIP